MRTQSLAFVLVAALAGCSSSAPTRTVTGALMAAPAHALIVAQSADHQQVSATVAATGRFTLQLATGASWELAVGQARVDWPTAAGAARWVKLGAGATLDLGHVSQQRDGHWACDHHASDDDHCDRDDDHDGGDHDDGDDGDDHDGDHGGGHACDGGTTGGGGTGDTGTGGVN